MPQSRLRRTVDLRRRIDPTSKYCLDGPSLAALFTGKGGNQKAGATSTVARPVHTPASIASSNCSASVTGGIQVCPLHTIAHTLAPAI